MGDTNVYLQTRKRMSNSNLIDKLTKEGMGSIEYEKLLEFKNYEQFRKDIGGRLPLFITDGTQATKKLAQHGYLYSSDRPNRYILSEKAKDLINRLSR